MGDRTDDAETAGKRCFEEAFRQDTETASALWKAACRYWIRDKVAVAGEASDGLSRAQTEGSFGRVK